MALAGVILDLDGTLVDTNALHVEAWRRALAQGDYTIAPDRIFEEIGKGGDFLVPALLGKQADKKDGDALRKAQPIEFGKLAKDGIRVFPQARELLIELRNRKLRTVLATSSAEKQVKVIEQASGLPVSDLVDEVVVSEDASRSKPAPDLVWAAVEKLGMSPAQCVMVGDTIFDTESARRAGVVSLGLLCGGNSSEALLSAGARQTYADPADLLAQLDEAISSASPGSLHLTQEALETLMRSALLQAEAGLAAGEAPIGSVLARGDGTIIAAGFNEMNISKNPTSHAEMIAFAKAAKQGISGARDLLLVSTLEPCIMCTGAAMVTGVDTIIYGLRAPADSGTMRVAPARSPESQMPRIVGDVLAAHSRTLFERWLELHVDDVHSGSQTAYVKQLLAGSK
jgi:HAD superfamily hydrolase (TIGR01509 family)